MFYGNLSDKHFYKDGYNYDYYDQYGLQDNITETSRGLRYVRPHEKLEAGVDFGNMISMVLGQEQWPHYRILKSMYVLSPKYIQDLADLYIKFFQPNKRKEIDIYYDRSANQYRKQKQDLATKLKKAIEKRVITNGRLNQLLES